MTTPPDFVHLHVHSQYSILDGQASIQKLVDKAMRDGQPGIALTDHGNMFGIKEFYNYVKKVKGKYKAQAAEAEARLAALVDGSQAPADPAEIARCRAELADLKRKAAFKPIIGSEVYVARRRMQDKEGKPDQSGYHLILLAKNLKGYHNLIKIVSKAWTEGFYMRPRTDRVELEKYHEGLICCSACLARCPARLRPTTCRRPRRRSCGTKNSSATTITSNCSCTRPPSSGPTTKPIRCSSK